MELGADAVLLNTAVAKAQFPILMAQSMKHAVIAGRLAKLSQRRPMEAFASASSPEFGLIGPKAG
jgi:thiazole synthase